MNAMPPTVLLVEDDPNDALLIQRGLKRIRPTLAIRHVDDGERAVAFLGGTGDFADRSAHPPPSLVLLDLKLPRRSGHEVLAWLRAQPVLRRTPVVVLTSSQLADDVDRAYDLGANSYMVKPGTPDALLALLGLLDRYWNDANETPSIARS